MTTTTSNTTTNIIDRIHALTTDIAHLYAHPSISSSYISHFNSISSPFNAHNPSIPQSTIPDPVLRVHNHAKQLNLPHTLSHVPSDYYQWDLTKRAYELRAPSINHLCKTVFFENTRYKDQSHNNNNTINELDPLNSRYYCVITPYTSKLNSAKLNSFIRDVLGQSSMPKKWFNFRVTTEEDCKRYTGFENGGVAPLGLVMPVPVIVPRSLLDLEPGVVWLGGGHVDWKLAVEVKAFIEKMGDRCFVADLE